MNLPEGFKETYSLDKGQAKEDEFDLENHVRGVWLSLQLSGHKAGNQVVDIGCGNTDDRLDRRSDYLKIHSRRHEPWLSRLAAWTGGNAIGLDAHQQSSPIEAQNNGSWNYIAIDLKADSKLSCLQDRKFDLVALNSVVHSFDLREGSPGLLPLPLTTNSEVLAAFLERSDSFSLMEAYEQFRMRLIRASLGLLAPNGVFMLNHNCFKRSGEQLLPANGETQALARQCPEMFRPPYESTRASQTWAILKNRVRNLSASPRR